MSTKDVANFIAATSFNELPADVVAKAKVAIRDTLGVAVGGYSDKASEAVRRLATEMGGREESTIIGAGVKVPRNVASWVNAVTASTLDFDDGAFGSKGHLCHPGCMVIPSALAVGEIQNATGKDFIEAVVVGYEVALRASLVRRLVRTQPALGASGTYGVAAVASKLLRLPPETIVTALGLAEANRPSPTPAAIWRDRSPAGIHEWAEHTAMTKENCGWAAMVGVTAALLARAGFEGPRTMFDLPMDSKEPLETLGKEWETLNTYFKPYSACRGLHSSIYGTLKLVQEHNLSADAISRVTARVNDLESHFNKYRPSTRYEGQMSIPFTIGALLVEGEVTPKQIAWERLDDAAILRQADKVKVLSDPEINHAVSARVEIETKDGKKFDTFVQYVLGEPQNPLSEEELSQKFTRLATDVLGVDRTEELRKCLSRLEDLGSVNELVEKVSHFG